jgi:hypothetical protein
MGYIPLVIVEEDQVAGFCLVDEIDIHTCFRLLPAVAPDRYPVDLVYQLCKA